MRPNNHGKPSQVSTMVIMSGIRYIREAHRQLSNIKFYKKLDATLRHKNVKQFN